MAQTKHLVGTLLFLFASSGVVLAQPPFYFNYQPQQQHRFSQNTYQPFTNAPTYYQPTYQTHSPDSNSNENGRPSLLNDFFGGDFGRPTSAPASSPLVTYPTQVTTLRGGPEHNLASQSYQPVGNSIYQQQPPTTSVPFRPSPLITNHHTHIVNGLPRQQFFGNNYDFFRQRHGLNLLPTTTGPFHQPPTQTLPSPTPSILLSATSTAQTPSKPNESKSAGVKFVDDSSKPTQPTIVSTFPSFNSIVGGFSPAASLSPATTPTPRIPKAQPTSTPSSAVGVSPSFGFTQYFPEIDSNGSNELIRQPLFGAEEEDEEVDDDNFTFNHNNANTVYDDKRQTVRPLPTAAPSQIPYQRAASPANYATGAPLSSPFKSSPYSNALNTVNTQTKDEPTPIRIHNTTPIRIVFNYEQALEALQQNPGVRVVVAHTEKNNMTQEESTTTARPSYYSPASSARPTQVLYQTTSRPVETATYRPQVSPLTQRPPQGSPIPTRFDYQAGLYTVTGRTTTTAEAELENLALELEGRQVSTSSPVRAPSPRPVIQTVATFATETPYQTENPLQTYRKGSKKYIVVPNGGNLYKAEEPRVVVNNLANVVVQDLPQGVPPNSPTQPSFPFKSSFPQPTFPYRSIYTQQEPRQQQTFPTRQQQTFPTRGTVTEQYVDDDNVAVGQPIAEDLREEIENLSQQIQQEIETTTQITTTTRTTTPRPPPPRVRVTTNAPRLLRITTYRPPGTYRTTPRQAPLPVVEDDASIDEIPGNALAQEPVKINQPVNYYYNNNNQRGGLSGAYQKYEYNDADSPSTASAPTLEDSKPVVRRRQRVRGRLVAGGPPRPVQVSAPVVRPSVVPQPAQLGPIPVSNPVAAVQSPVFRVGPRGRLLRRKIRPRTQQPTATTPQEAQPSSTPAQLVSDLPQVRQEIAPVPNLAPLYSPTPYIPQAAFPVTTFRPNLAVQQNLSDDEDDVKDDQRGVDQPATFRSRFRFTPSSTARAPTQNDNEDVSNQYESDEEAPVVPQRRRPQFSTTTSTTEKPSSNQVISDRANILQRQIRFNRNKKNNQRSS